jgi:hypothetical protein
MWSGLTSKNLNLAILKTVTFVQILPWFVIGFAAALMVPLLLMPRLMAAGAATPGWMMSWYPALSSAIGTALVVAKDVAFSLWARRRLYREFRSWPGVGPRQTLRP